MSEYNWTTENDIDRLCQKAVETALFPRKRLKSEIARRGLPAKETKNAE